MCRVKMDGNMHFEVVSDPGKRHHEAKRVPAINSFGEERRCERQRNGRLEQYGAFPDAAIPLSGIGNPLRILDLGFYGLTGRVTQVPWYPEIIRGRNILPVSADARLSVEK